MLVSIDKRGSISLPVAVRKDLNLLPGAFLDLIWTKNRLP